MYTFVTAHCLARTVGSQWVELDISKSLVSAVFGTFRQTYIIVHDSYTDSNLIVNMDFFKAVYSGMNINVEEMLQRHNGLPIDTVPSLPNTDIKYARYSIGTMAGYKYDFAKAGYMYDPNVYSDILTDIRIDRPGYDTDIRLLHSHCLVSVNGFIHNTDTDGRYCYVIDGGKTMRIAQDNRFGILSFLDIGELTKIRINPEDIFPAEEGGVLKDKIVFKISEDIEESCFMLVLGGYLIVPEPDIFYRQGSNSYILDINKIPYLERIMESREFIDISSLGLNTTIINDKIIESSNAYSDEVIRNYLCMSQSFFVKVDTPNLTTRKFSIQRSNTPGQFICYQKPTVPMFVKYGRMVEYWSQKQGERYSVAVPDSYFRNYALRYRKKEDVQNIDDTFMAENPIYHYGGVFLEISSYS